MPRLASAAVEGDQHVRRGRRGIGDIILYRNTTPQITRPAPGEVTSPGPRSGGHRLADRLLASVNGPRGSWTLQVLVSTLIMAALLHLRYGYAVGDRDHTVLSLLGMQWAHPDWFAGDWAVDNAPQPHWAFDVLTWFGSATNTLGGLYLIYWLVSLAIFGVATTLLARAWSPRHVWLAITTVTVLAAMSPATNLGTGTAMFATPLPNVLGGGLLYLTCAALLVGRHRWAGVAGAATAVAHVQQGAVTAVLLGVMTLAVWVRERRADRSTYTRRNWTTRFAGIDWTLAISAAVTLLIVMVELRIRPVAGHLSDFAEACRIVIPYHCDATTWSASYLFGGLAMIGLALLTTVFLPATQRFRAAVVLGLPAVGLLIGVTADRFDVPTLGVIAEGVNVYRLMLVLVPFALWGMMAPVLADLTPRARWRSLAVVVFGSFFALGLTWDLDTRITTHVWLLRLGVCAAIALGCLARAVPSGTRWAPTLLRVGCAGLVLVFLVIGVASHQLKRRELNLTLYPHGNEAIWGEQAQRLVPPGSQILIPPAEWHLRMMTKRAVVVDCKYGAYGGEPWQEYKRRIEALGGFDQCLHAKVPRRYEDLTAAELTAIAQRYGAGYIVIGSVDAKRGVKPPVPGPADLRPQVPAGAGSQLLAQGWTILIGPLKNAKFYLLKAPPAKAPTEQPPSAN